MKRVVMRIVIAIALMMAGTMVSANPLPGERKEEKQSLENSISLSTADMLGIPASIDGHAWLKGFEGNWTIWVCKPPYNVKCATWEFTATGVRNVVIDPEGNTIGPIYYPVALYQEVEGGADGTEYWFNEADYVE